MTRVFKVGDMVTRRELFSALDKQIKTDQFGGAGPSFSRLEDIVQENLWFIPATAVSYASHISNQKNAPDVLAYVAQAGAVAIDGSEQARPFLTRAARLEKVQKTLWVLLSDEKTASPHEDLLREHYFFVLDENGAAWLNAAHDAPRKERSLRNATKAKEKGLTFGKRVVTDEGKSGDRYLAFSTRFVGKALAQIAASGTEEEKKIAAQFQNAPFVIVSAFHPVRKNVRNAYYVLLDNPDLALSFASIKRIAYRHQFAILRHCLSSSSSAAAASVSAPQPSDPMSLAGRRLLEQQQK